MIDQTRKAKIKWHCRRGMLELDLLLNQFIEQSLDKLQDNQVSVFEQLLNTSDPELYCWLMGSEKPADKEMLAIVELIQMHNRVK
ncbi:YgfY [Legionella busanensis]|uniref:FAD assembly factor SdhE n=1 Tax=Legionella busanensis TaxID=190655 RepID=A0A378JN58_9GAMM|nr:succinate dehydrogenase assembly factor 2 [Legionella busanensis]STX51723.1 YgfY [Legionella busanensis]